MNPEAGIQKWVFEVNISKNRMEGGAERGVVIGDAGVRVFEFNTHEMAYLE